MAHDNKRYVKEVNVSTDAYPIVAGKCPACGFGPLFLGAGGYVTCSWIRCSDPCAASDLLEGKERVNVEAHWHGR